MRLTYAFALTLLFATAVPAQDCSQVPPEHRAACEAALAQQGVAGSRAADANQATSACEGLTGDARENCLAHHLHGGQADCSKLPPEKQAGCERMKGPAAEAREACKGKYDKNDQTAFRACMKAEMAKRRGGH